MVLGVLDPGFKSVITVIGLSAVRGGHQVWPAKRFVCRRSVVIGLRARVRGGLCHRLAVGVEGGGDQHIVGICQRLASEAIVTARHREGVGRVDLLVQRDDERRILVRDRQRLGGVAGARQSREASEDIVGGRSHRTVWVGFTDGQSLGIIIRHRCGQSGREEDSRRRSRANRIRMIRRVVDRAGRARARRRRGRDTAISAPGCLRRHIPPRVMRHAHLRVLASANQRARRSQYACGGRIVP